MPTLIAMMTGMVFVWVRPCFEEDDDDEEHCNIVVGDVGCDSCDNVGDDAGAAAGDIVVDDDDDGVLDGVASIRYLNDDPDPVMMEGTRLRDVDDDYRGGGNDDSGGDADYYDEDGGDDGDDDGKVR